ncbi:hypothetical protein NPIL_603641, partial [Nephila pilipes]
GERADARSSLRVDDVDIG